MFRKLSIILAASMLALPLLAEKIILGKENK